MFEIFIDSRSIQPSLTDLSAFPRKISLYLYQYLYILTWTGPKPASSHRRCSHPAQTVQYGCGQRYISTKCPGFLHLDLKALDLALFLYPAVFWLGVYVSDMAKRPKVMAKQKI